MPPSLTERLAEYLDAVTFAALPPAVAEKTAFCLMDYTAAAWNGTTHRAWPAYRDMALKLGGRGSAALFGGQSASPYWAGFANAACGHLTEVDDTHKRSSMHVGVVVFPAILAVSALCPLSGRQFVEAAVCGYEAAIRTGIGLGAEHASLYHSTGTAGTFGAAAAAAKALGLDAAGIASALGHAGTQAFALWQFLSDKALDAKAFHPARAVQNGLNAAFLASAGIGGPSCVLEGERGLFARLRGTPAPEAMLENLGASSAISEACFKCYPVCGQIHSPLDALREAMQKADFTAQDVISVTVETYGQAMRLTDRPAPENMQAMRFSLQGCLAFMLLYGDVTFSNFTEEACFTPAMREMLSRMRVEHSDAMEARFPAERPCRVRVELADGRRFSAERAFRRGDPEAPLSRAQMEAKLRQLAPAALGPRLDAVCAWIWALADHREISASAIADA